MKVLSIDTDFFLSDLTTIGASTGSRLPADTFKPWRSKEVGDFLGTKLGLAAGTRIPGWTVRRHDELFRHWYRAISTGSLTTPFDLVHVDAHSDLGVDMAGSRHFVATQLLQTPADLRPAACIPHLVQGNFVLLALACRWLSSFTFIHHPKWDGDYPSEILHWENDQAVGLQARAISVFNWSTEIRNERYSEPQTEPLVPLRTFNSDSAPPLCAWDFIGVARSPDFTPAAADGIYKLLATYAGPLSDKNPDPVKG